MKRTIFILIVVFSKIFSLFSQENEKYGWNNLEWFNIAGGYKFSEKELGITSMDFVKFSTSIGKASPYQSFGIGTEVLEVMNFHTGSFANICPITLYFIPWMDIEAFEYYDYKDNGTYTQGNYTYHSYKYDPNVTIYKNEIRSAIMLSLSGTFWGAYYPAGDRDGMVIPWDKKVFNFRAAYVHNFKKISKNRSYYAHLFSTMSAEFNYNVLFINSNVNYFPNIGLRFNFRTDNKIY